MKIINSKPLSNTAYIAKWAVINIPEKELCKVYNQKGTAKVKINKLPKLTDY